MTSGTALDIEGMIVKYIAQMREHFKIPDGRPCDEIDRVANAGVNYIVSGTVVDDEVYHPVSGFVYRRQRVQDLVEVLCIVIAIDPDGYNGSLPQDGVQERWSMYRHHNVEARRADENRKWLIAYMESHGRD